MWEGVGLGAASPLFLPMNNATLRGRLDEQLLLLPKRTAMARHAVFILFYPVHSATLLAMGTLKLHGAALLVLAA